MPITVTIKRIIGPTPRKVNDRGSAVVRTENVWTAVVQLPSGKEVTASWVAATYDRNDLIAAARAANAAAPAIPDEGASLDI